MTQFEVWAPMAARVEVEVGLDRHELARTDRPGWWAGEVEGGHGIDYGFVLDGEGPLPDPRSAWQPLGVHGLSRVYDHRGFAWTDLNWRARPLRGSVLYELHVGTFTGEGTFDAAVTRLDHLVSLGVDVVEVMPVAAFPGTRGWGYDGVHLWAVHEPYGGPDGFKRFVDACHARDIAVVLDVVYNHLGPSGNYLSRFGPYFTQAHHTPWGQAVNLDQPGSDEVRTYLLDNARMWLRDFHLDGLRLDAVHELKDTRATHLLEELAAQANGLLIAESDLNDPRMVTVREAGGLGLDAQWNDDLHHALHAALTGETQGYYADFGSMAALAKTLTGAFFHDGTYSAFRGRHHGRPVDPRIPPSRFVVCLQNHDQIGNRAAGDRLPADVLTLGAALLLTSPYTPMIFMGEEWGATTPWCYFTDHQEPELARAVTEGRRREFAEHGWAGEVPDPQAEETFGRSVLDWDEGNQGLLGWYRALIALRRARPELTGPQIGVSYDEDDRWLIMDRGTTRVLVNFGGDAQLLPAGGELLLATCGEVHQEDGGLVLPGRSAAIVSG
ncbi:MAG: malto-oligosyltrehalose trehalohydrolase [Streptosporangiaceae bacterium]